MLRLIKSALAIESRNYDFTLKNAETFHATRIHVLSPFVYHHQTKFLEEEVRMQRSFQSSIHRL